MNGYFKRFAPVLGILVMTSVFATAKESKGTHQLTLSHPALIGGTQVPAGSYNVKWVSHSPEATVTFEQHHQVMATTEGKWVDRDTVYRQNAVVFDTRPDGSESIVEIRFAGMSKALVFGASSPSAELVPRNAGVAAATMPAWLGGAD